LDFKVRLLNIIKKCQKDFIYFILFFEDEKLIFANFLKFPTFKVDCINLIKRITLILKNNKIIKYFYPVFSPDQDANEVISWLKKVKYF
jgi:peroxiredoxin